MGCLLSGHAQRGSSPLVCSTCDSTIESHVLFDSRQQTGQGADYRTAPGSETIDERHLQTRRPFQLLLRQELSAIENSGDDEPAEISVLYFARVTKEGKSGARWQDNVNISTVVKTFRRVGDGLPYDAEGCGKLCQFFAFLNPIIIPPSITPKNMTRTLEPRKFFEESISKYTPLMACLYGLATANASRPLELILQRDRPDYQSQYLAVLAAHDILLRANVKHPLNFQLMLGSELLRQGASRYFRDLLSSFRLSGSREFSVQKQCQAVVAYLLKGREVGINDMHITNGDNFGMVLKGEEASYVQRILFQNIILRSHRLKARCEAEVKKLFAKKYPAFSTESGVRDLLNEKIYCLSDEVFGEERYKSLISNH